MRIFGKILLLISGILILIWGIGDISYAVSELVNKFPWAQFSDNIYYFIGLMLALLLSLLFIFAGLGGIMTFIHAKPRRVHKINIYATIILVIAIIVSVSNSIYLIVNSINKVDLSNMLRTILEIVFDLLLPLIYFFGARLVRKSLR